MSIPVVPEHNKCKYDCDDCALTDECDKAYADVNCPLGCMPDCPACAVEANNKAWAKYLDGRHNGTTFEDPADIKSHYALIAIPISDWEHIKKLAEEG